MVCLILCICILSPTSVFIDLVLFIGSLNLCLCLCMCVCFVCVCVCVWVYFQGKVIASLLKKHFSLIFVPPSTSISPSLSPSLCTPPVPPPLSLPPSTLSLPPPPLFFLNNAKSLVLQPSAGFSGAVSEGGLWCPFSWWQHWSHPEDLWLVGGADLPAHVLLGRGRPGVGQVCLRPGWKRVQRWQADV